MRNCGCPIMEEKLHQLYRYQDLRVLYEDDKITLEDIWAEDWLVMQSLMLKDNTYRRELKERQERMKEMANRFGK